MPRVLGQFPGGYSMEFDDGSTGMVPDYMVPDPSGFTSPGQQQGAAPAPTAAPTTQAADLATDQAVATSPAQEPPRPNPGALSAGQSVSRSGTRPYKDPKLVEREFGLPQAQTPDEMLAPQAAAAEQGKQTLREAGKLEAGRADAAQPFLEQERLEHESRAASIAQANAEAQADFQNYQRSIDEKLAAVPKKDPSRLWHNMSNWQKASLVGGAFLAGFAGGTAGANGYWDTVQQFVENDLRSQDTDIETAREGVRVAERTAERGRQNTLDRMRLDNEAYLERLAGIKAGLVAEQAKYESPLIQNKYQQAIDRVDQGISEKRAEAEKVFFTQRLQLANERAQQYHQRNQEQIQRAQIAQRANEFKEEMAFKRDELGLKAGVGKNSNLLADPAVNAGRDFIISKNVADKDQRLKNWSDKENGISQYAHVTSELKEYLALSKKLGRSYSGPGARTAAALSEQQQMRAELEGKYNQIIQKSRHSLFGAALTKQEAASFEAALPKPDALLGPKGAKIVQGYIETKAKEAQREFINPLGIVDAQTGQPVDLIKEWGTIEEPDAPEYLNSGQIVASGSQIAAGLSQLPRDKKGGVTDSTGREQVNMLVSRSEELARRANSYAERSGLTPEVAGEAVNSMREWAARLDSAGYSKEAEQVERRALELEDKLGGLGDQTPLDVVKVPPPGTPNYVPGLLGGR